jgi:hypothetical protein
MCIARDSAKHVRWVRILSGLLLTRRIAVYFSEADFTLLIAACRHQITSVSDHVSGIVLVPSRQHPRGCA